MRKLPPDATPRGETPPPDAHRWISLCDDDDGVWMFDVTYLLSHYHCIYGRGCPGIDEEPDHSEAFGCCIHGAYFVDDDDLDTTHEYVQRLTEEDWQFKSVADASTNGRQGAKGKPRNYGAYEKIESGEWTTRIHNGACIFLNRPDFHSGAGCALHTAAVRHGERPMDWKPDVCWQVPIRMDVHTDDNGHDTVFVRAWERRDWGDGGADFHWWCIEEDAAYTADDPVYRTSRDELIGFVGEPLYERLVTELERIAGAAETPVDLRPTRSGR